MKRTDTDIEIRVIELYENGETMKSIGLQLNIGPVSVKNILERFGIPISQSDLKEEKQNFQKN